MLGFSTQSFLATSMEDGVPTFWIGYHDDKSQRRGTLELIQQAHSLGVGTEMDCFVLV